MAEETTAKVIRRPERRAASFLAEIKKHIGKYENNPPSTGDGSKKQNEDASPDTEKLKKDDSDSRPHHINKSISHPDESSQSLNKSSSYSQNDSRRYSCGDNYENPVNTSSDLKYGRFKKHYGKFYGSPPESHHANNSRISNEQSHNKPYLRSKLNNRNTQCRDNNLRVDVDIPEGTHDKFALFRDPPQDPENSYTNKKYHKTYDSFDRRNDPRNSLNNKHDRIRSQESRTQKQTFRDQFDSSNKNFKTFKGSFNYNDHGSYSNNKSDKNTTNLGWSNKTPCRNFDSKFTTPRKNGSVSPSRDCADCSKSNGKSLETVKLLDETDAGDTENLCEFKEIIHKRQISNISYEGKSFEVTFSTSSISEPPKLTDCTEWDTDDLATLNSDNKNNQAMERNLNETSNKINSPDEDKNSENTFSTSRIYKLPKLTDCTEWDVDDLAPPNSDNMNINIQALELSLDETSDNIKISHEDKKLKGVFPTSSVSEMPELTQYTKGGADDLALKNSVGKNIQEIDCKLEKTSDNTNNSCIESSVNEYFPLKLNNNENLKVTSRTSDKSNKIGSKFKMNKNISSYSGPETVKSNKSSSHHFKIKNEKCKTPEIQDLVWNIDDTEMILSKSVNSKFDASDSWNDISQQEKTVSNYRDIRTQKLLDSVNNISKSNVNLTKLNKSTKKASNDNSILSEKYKMESNVQQNKLLYSSNQTPNRMHRPENSVRIHDTFAGMTVVLPTETQTIPPPVSCKEIVISKNFCSSEASSNTSEKSNINDCSSDSSSICSLSELDPKQLEAITDYINKEVKEKHVRNTLADKVVKDMNRLFSKYLEGNTVDRYGSYYSDIAIETSNMNLVMKSDSPVRRGYMQEVYKVISKEQTKYNVHPFEEGDNALKTKIQFLEPETGINCQLAYLGKYADKYRQMAEMLRVICLYDKRVKSLIIAVKIWAEICLINEIEEGKLHPIGYIIMVIHFLQHYEKPILPTPIVFYKDCKIESPPKTTDSTIGELWMAFLSYYLQTFNWARDVVTIMSEEPVSKKSKNWEKVWMAIEDPYTGKNIAQSVTNSDTAEKIRACFRATYDYFCSNPSRSIAVDSEDEGAENNKDSPNWRPQYSFQDCMIDVSTNFCEMCDELDDVCEDCKEKIYSPPMDSVPAMTESFLRKIREALLEIYGKYMLTEAEINERKDFVQNLERQFMNSYPDIKLHLFGSSSNGFGFKNSDLDICVTFSSCKVYNTIQMLKTLRSRLNRTGDYDNVVGIFGATIPILKFHFKPKGWRGDICINNSLAVDNSKLLHTYSLIDERCKILGCALKLLAKKALIAEVTDKALSSYSYLIMVIHFLQQLDPPILPVLQDIELQKSNFKLDCMVDGYNVWFYTNIKDLKLVENNTSVEQLWLDLLDFYCSYDTHRYITIRQKEPLFLADKISARSFNIQDPFIEEKNLGRVVSSKKAQEMENIFRRARRLFRTPKEFPSGVKDDEDYFFSTMSLTGRIHKEAHCDLCGKYGHEKKDCSHSAFMLNFQRRKYPVKHSYHKPIITRKTNKHVSV